jgi:hypothetical protein
MKPSELRYAARVEERNPTDRVRGTVVNVDSSGMFVVKYDNGDYLAFQREQAQDFDSIPEKPIPGHARELMRRIYDTHGRTPPEDVIGVAGKVPGARRGVALTRDAAPPTIEA